MFDRHAGWLATRFAAGARFDLKSDCSPVCPIRLPTPTLSWSAGQPPGS